MMMRLDCAACIQLSEQVVQKIILRKFEEISKERHAAN